MTISRAEKMAKRGRNSVEIRLGALTQELRNIALGAPLEQGTRNRLHAIASAIDSLVEGIGVSGPQVKPRCPPVQWTRSPATTAGSL